MLPPIRKVQPREQSLNVVVIGTLREDMRQQDIIFNGESRDQAKMLKDESNIFAPELHF